VHDLHIWTAASGQVALSAHVVLTNMNAWNDTLQRLRVLLHERFGIDHVTLQPEPSEQILRLVRPDNN